MSSYADRLARLETHREHDRRLLEQIAAKQDQIDGKLDDLLARPAASKGASITTTTGVSAITTIVMNVLKGLFHVDAQ